MSTLRFATFLSPVLYETYEYIAHYVGERLGYPTTLSVGQAWEQFAKGEVDAGFLCGLPYARLSSLPACPIELLAAPVVQGPRYQGKPIYFSDVIVRSDSLCTALEHLQGCVWAYNEIASHSGYNIVCHSLLQRGKRLPFFDEMLKTGSHLKSVQAVLEGMADGTAIDSHVLDVWFLQHPDLAQQLRVIDMFGPSTIPPVVASIRLDEVLKRSIQEVLLQMHLNPIAARQLRYGLIEKFAVVSDEDYAGLQRMAMSVGSLSSIV
jgi:phosphonate transport system substrate-binding protein